jgi:hypothetical protein
VTDPQDPPPPSGLADPTRDIRLPPRPGTPGPDFPPEWEALQPAEPPPPDEALAELPTDEVASRRPETPDRDPTLTFDGSARERWAAGHAATPDPVWSAASGSVVVTGRRRPRRWPWVVLTLLPLVVIAVSGVWLLLLMR